MTPIEFGIMFVLGLVSSLHCVQMCGPIVLAYSVALDSAKNPAIPSLLQNHLAYHAGRILTYSALGAIAGLVGAMLGFVGRIAGFGHILALIAGGLMILVGLSLFGLIPASIIQSRFFHIPSSIFRRIGRLLSEPGLKNRFALGLALGFLPCGLIYAALLKATSSGSAVGGALAMLAFGLGTSGALLVLGLFSSAIRIRLNRWGSQFAAAGVTLMGVLLVWRGTMAPMLMMGAHMHAHH
ncbi:MAG TPA: sulfite exporter TauE/SafE family protein [Candidatus Sulfotelmatobacter sp.]|nr:sulfite exporter TauE/SafE family protein [Candidatus Sulfotelmatobacter sp.]